MNTDSSAPGKRYHHGDLRQALLLEAARLLRDEGESALSMRRLADCVGVSRTAAYHHFKDKQGLFCAIAEEGFDRILKQSQQLQQELGELVGEERLYRFVESYLHFALQHSEYYDLMFGSQLWKSGAVTPELTQKAHEFFRFHVSTLRESQELGHISESVDLVRHSQVTMSTLHGMSRLLIDGIYVDKATVDSIGRSAAGMFWRELQAS